MLTILWGDKSRDALLRLFCRSVGEEKPDNLWLTPETYSFEQERSLCAAVGDRLSRYGEVVTFKRLALRVLEECGQARAASLDPGGRILAMRRAAELAKLRRSAIRRPDFLRSALQSVDELKSYGVSAERLAEAGCFSGKLEDIARVYAAYDAVCADLSADPRDRLSRAAQILRDKPKKCHLYIYGFSRFTMQEYDILKPFFEHAEVHIAFYALPRGIGAYDAPWMEIERRTAERLSRIYPALRQERVSDSAHSLLPETDNITLINAASPVDECRWAACKCLELAAEGMRWRDIAIACEYMPVLDGFMREYGVPLQTDAMSALSNSAAARFCDAALRAVSEDYPLEIMRELIQSGLCGLSPDEADKLENYVLMWSKQGTDWTVGLPWRESPYGALTCEDSEDSELSEINNNASRIAVPLIALERNLRESSGAADMAVALYNYFESVGLPGALCAREEAQRSSGMLREAELTHQTWDVLVHALEQFSAVLGSESLRIDELCELFKLTIGEYSLGAIPISADSVRGGNLERVLSMSPKVLIILGASQNNIPSASSAPGLISDADRVALEGSGIELSPYGEQRLYNEMGIISRVFRLPSEHLYISWPRTSSAGGKLSLSPLIAQEWGPEFVSSAQEADIWPPERLCGASEAYKRHAAMKKSDARAALSTEGVTTLYPRGTQLGASRLELFNSCAYAYFCRYGMRAEPRRVKGWEAPETGSFIHEVLKTAVCAYSERGLSGEALRDYAGGLAHELAGELPPLYSANARLKWRIGRLCSIAADLSVELADELSRSQFRPALYEHRVGGAGIADRVDFWEYGGERYVRVIDYKSGTKKLSLKRLYYGLDMQMLMYMNALLEEYPGSLPAGVLYVPASADDSMQNRTGEKPVRKRSGLIVSEPELLRAMEKGAEAGEALYMPVKLKSDGTPARNSALASAVQFKSLLAHTVKLASESRRRVAAGELKPVPLCESLTDSPCLFCSYAGVCRFGSREGDRAFRMPAMPEEVFWESIR